MNARELSKAYTLCAAILVFFTACGGTGCSGKIALTPTTYSLAVNSTNPARGVAIGAAPADASGVTNGTTGFTFTYTAGASVTLTAPATSGGNTFASWTGCTTASTVTCTVVMNADATVTANYALPATYALAVNSTNPARGVAIGAAPADAGGVTTGTTGFTLTYTAGTSVTLTAPATSGSNPFASWTGCTTASAVTCTVVMNANATVTANYALLPQYHAYGDSITYGYTLIDPATQAYPALVAAYEDLPLKNFAISGDQACDVPTRQIFSNEDSPTLAGHTVYSVLIGTNDVDAKGIGAYESVFELCHQATLSWLAVPVEYKVLAGDSSVTTSGPGAIDSSNNWNAWTTAGQGSSVSFQINLIRSGPIYAWPRINDDNPSTYTYSLDGVVLGTSNTQTNPSISTQNGTTNSLGFLRLPTVLAGNHVVTFTQTSAGINGVSVVGIGTPVGPTTNTLPTVLAGTIPYQFNDGKCTSSSDEPCLEYINDIELDVSLFSADGLDIRLFDTREYMFGTAAEMSDSLHPNVLGQVELSQSVEALW